MSDSTGMQPDWGAYYHDQGAEQDMVDPALRGPMADPSRHGEFTSYNPWMSASQHWSN